MSSMGVSFVLPRRWGRAYFALQALSGAVWWVAVFAWPLARTSTLGALDPVLVAAADIPLFVIASAIAAAGVRTAAVIATVWTCVVSVALAAYATVSTLAGWGVLLMLAAAGCSVIALCAMLLGRLPAEWIVQGPFRFRPASAHRSTAAHVVATFGQIVVFWGFFLAVLPVVIAFLESRWGFRLPFPLCWSSPARWASGRPSRCPRGAAARRCRWRCRTASSSRARTAGCATRWRWPASSRPSRSVCCCSRGWSSPTR
jgi:hypothetical protein